MKAASRTKLGAGALLLLGGLTGGLRGQSAAAQHFESHIRPVLVEHCYRCHHSHGTAKAGLALDSRDGIRRPSASGTAVVPGVPADSLLLRVIRHELPGLEMPKDGVRLGADVVADFDRWIRDGAFDPRDEPPSGDELVEATSWSAILARRKQWWSHQPIRDVAPPASSWSTHPIDRFVHRRMVEQGLAPSAPAERRTLLRRMTFAVTGLPPTQEQIERYLADARPTAIATEALVDRLLDSPHFGERWARHWMDLVRYADSHGSEGDPIIPHAYRYRDYLIRAFNQDVPYDQLVREHVAGDLLASPRIDPELGIDESAIGPAHWRLVFHGFAPTDALDEKVRFTDDQVNVFGKAFLGMTISCARCHDHKFDAISQADYTALFGILGSCRPATRDVNTTAVQAEFREELAGIKGEIRIGLVTSWLDSTRTLAGRLRPGGALAERMSTAADRPGDALQFVAEIERRVAGGDSFAEAWRRSVEAWETEPSSLATGATGATGAAPLHRWDLGQDADLDSWFADGNGLFDAPARAGAFAVEPGGDRALTGIYPAGVYSHLLSNRHRAVLESPRLGLPEELEAWLMVMGGGQAMTRFVVRNYPRGGTVYPIHELERRDWTWDRFDLSYWKGDEVHFELVTARDAPVEVRDQERSWFGVREVVVMRRGDGPPAHRSRPLVAPIVARAVDTAAPVSRAGLIDLFVDTVGRALEAWRTDATTDAEALLLDACVRDGLLPNALDELPEVRPLIDAYREIEGRVPEPTRVPGVSEADAFDHPLLDRGDHRRPHAAVPRRFLEVVDARPYRVNKSGASGRLQLAEDLLREDNPLTARVIVNRIWHHLFGRGIVATPDNFGRLGARPTHPELLDHLSTRMIESGWSIKGMVRTILLSRTWQLAADGSDRARDVDPDNRWLSRAPVRRLDGEAIRDSLLAATGQLDRQMYGPGFSANGTSRRRSVYVESRRNSLDGFLQSFDVPVPFSTTGRRAATNVPAQSLELLNDTFTFALAEEWAAAANEDATLATGADRVAWMFETALGRPPSIEERETLTSYADRCVAEIQRDNARREVVATDLAARRSSLARRLDPVRERLLRERGELGVGPGLAPFARWDFRVGLDDTLGDLDGALHGRAHLDGGGLVLDGGGHVSTPPITRALGAKTLEAWFSLADLEQRGGGVMTVQGLGGGVFDSIVFGERVPRRWIAGSDLFRRTRDLGGEDEVATDAPVHVAIAYDADGTIRVYRDGAPYGASYRAAPLVAYLAGDSQVLFGLRHGSPNPGRLLRGRIFEACLYDRALTAEEIEASAHRDPFVGAAAVRAALDEPTRRRVAELEEEIRTLEAERDRWGEPVSVDRALGRVAHALLNLKEFIFIR